MCSVNFPTCSSRINFGQCFGRFTETCHFLKSLYTVFYLWIITFFSKAHEIWASILSQLHSGYIIFPWMPWWGNPWGWQSCPVGLFNIVEWLCTRVLEHTPRFKCLLKYKWNTYDIIKKHGRAGAPLILVIALSMYQIVNVNWPLTVFTLEDEQIVSDGQIVWCENGTSKFSDDFVVWLGPSVCPSVKTICPARRTSRPKSDLNSHWNGLRPTNGRFARLGGTERRFVGNFPGNKRSWPSWIQISRPIRQTIRPSRRFVRLLAWKRPMTSLQSDTCSMLLLKSRGHQSGRVSW